nr:proton-conducting transporter membrane subunit [Dehalococcoidales bacterium]
LFNHAFFKALLFLGSGSVIHAVHDQDMRNMGGLGGKLKITFVTMLFASLALAGIPPFSGFWSKDEILAGAFEKDTLLYIIGAVAAFFTAFYIFRAMFMTFTGKYRGAPAHDSHGSAGGHGHDSVHASASPEDELRAKVKEHASGHGEHGIHESPWVMTVPLILLAIPSLLSGLLGSPFMGMAFQSFIEKGAEVHEELNYTVMMSSIAIAVAGILLSSLVYYFKIIPANLISRPLPWLHAFVLNKYAMDDLYGWIVNSVVLGASRAALWFDQYVVDGIVNGVANLVGAAGGALRKVETGQIPNYGLAIFAGAVVISAVLIISGSTL